jgi:hypothetical protein
LSLLAFKLVDFVLLLLKFFFSLFLFPLLVINGRSIDNDLRVNFSLRPWASLCCLSDCGELSADEDVLGKLIVCRQPIWLSPAPKIINRNEILDSAKFYLRFVKPLMEKADNACSQPGQREIS